MDAPKPSTADDAPAGPRPLWRWLALVLLVAAPVGVFWNALPNGYHLDDHFRIVLNPELEQVAPLHRHFLDPATSSSYALIVQYRPMLPLTLSLSYAMAGAHDPVVYRAGNLAVHLVAVLALYGLLLQLLSLAGVTHRRHAVAFVASLAYAVHPVAGVPINYLCSRDLGLMQAFSLLALLVHVRGLRRGGGAGTLVLALVLHALSILSKTNAAALPLLVMALQLTVVHRSLFSGTAWRAALVKSLPFWLVVVGFFAWTKLGLAFSDAGQLLVEHPHRWTYPATQARLHLLYYLRNAFWPFAMRPVPDVGWVASLTDPGALAGAGVIVTSLLVAVLGVRRWPLVAFGILAYWLAFAPTSSLLPFRYAAADYRQVPSLPWLCLALTLTLGSLLRGRAAAVAAGLVVAWLGAGTWLTNPIWLTEKSLWSHAVEQGARPVAFLNLARVIEDEDRERARSLLHAALEQVPDYIRVHLQLGLLEIRAGEVDAGVDRMAYAVDLDPRQGDSHYWYAYGLMLAGRNQQALTAAEQALARGPELPHYRYRAARLAQVIGDDARTLEILAPMHASRGPHGDSLWLSGWSRQRSGDLAGAVADYDAYLRQDPGHYQATFNRAYALLDLGRFAEAAEGFRAAMALDPDRAPPHAHLARCLTALGDEAGAQAAQARYDAMLGLR